MDSGSIKIKILETNDISNIVRAYGNPNANEFEKSLYQYHVRPHESLSYETPAASYYGSSLDTEKAV